MKAKDTDAWRHRYLRILSGRADDGLDAQEDLQAIEDLVDEHLLRASVFKDEQGVVRGAALVSSEDGKAVPTLKGRLFVEDQKAILRSKTFVGRLKSNWPLFSGLVGIFIGWSLGLVTPGIQQRLFQHNHLPPHAARPANPARQEADPPKPSLSPTGSTATP